MRYDDLCSPAAESGIIATLLHNPQFIFNSEELNPRDFSDINNSCIYWGIRELAHSGVTQIDDYQLMTMLTSNKAVEHHIKQIDIKDIQDIFSLSEYACRHTVEEYRALVKDVQEYRAKRELYVSAEKLKTACLSPDVNTEDLHNMVYNIAENHSLLSSRSHPIRSFAEKLDELWQEQIDRQTGSIATIPLPIVELGEYADLEAGELLIFGANAKTGKSIMLLTCTVDLLKRGLTVLVIDSELSDRLYMLRLISHISKVEFKKVKDGTASPEEAARINAAREWIKTKKLYHEYVPCFNDTELLSTFRRVNCMDKVDVLVVDYLKITTGVDAFDVSLRLAGQTNLIKNDILGAFGIPGLAAVQTTENGSVALSKGVSRYCSTLFTMRRKTQDEIADDGVDCGNTYITCAFNRNGRQSQGEDDRVSVLFEGDICTFKSCPRQPEKKEPY